MKIKGVIFDMDGLILDTERLYQKFWIEACENCGYNLSVTQALQLRSLDKNLARDLLKDFFGSNFSYEKVHSERVVLMNQYIEENGVQPKPGVRELTDYLKLNKYKIAVATATNYNRANVHLTLAGVRDCFNNIICACDLNHGKPYPDVYLYACEKLNLFPNECVALEDSPNGIKSAYLAGCVPVCVPDTVYPDNKTEKMCFSIVENLFEVKKILSTLN